jgi:hypothetical protein
MNAECQCERVPVLCGCGWGSLGMPTCEVPETCPVCGFNLWEAFGAPEPCAPREEGACEA